MADSPVAAMSHKKQAEWGQLAYFLRELGQTPAGHIEAHEEPDFLIRGQVEIVGVELTELHREVESASSPLQAQEALRRRAVERAQAIFTDKHTVPMQVYVNFNDCVPIHKSDVEALAQAIASLVEKNIPAAGSRFVNENYRLSADVLPRQIHRVAAYHFSQVTQAFFTCPGSTWVPPLRHEDVQRVLSAKEVKCKRYRKNCDQAWLVISTNTRVMSTWFEMDTGALKLPYQTGFDRVFLTNHFKSGVDELKLEKAAL